MITKLEAAQCQIDTAIRLWFREEDPVSVHTLACSAYQIVHDINKQRSPGNLLYDSLRIKDEHRQEVVRCLKKPFNFFKHANSDPDCSLEFNTDTTPYFILYTILGLEFLNVPHTIPRRAFSFYFAMTHPHLLTNDYRELMEKTIPVEHLTTLRNAQRNDFFEDFHLLLLNHDLLLY